MKTDKLIRCFTICIMLIGAVNCNNAQTQKKAQTKDDYSEEQVVSMLKTFYTSYTTENFKRPPLYSQDKVDSIKRKYCKTEVLNLFKDSIDYDPFTHAQMFDIETLKTLSIRKDSERDNLYYASFLWDYEKKQVTIKLSVVKEDGDYKIDHVFLEDFKEESIDKR